MVRFGPSGNSESFYSEGYKSSLQMPSWLSKLGLNAYEYQCSKGVRIKEDMAKALGEEAKKNDVFLSIHAPYYINMSSVEEEKRINSKKYIIESMKAAKWMGAQRVVVHTGSCSNMDRRVALKMAIDVLKETICEADAMGFSDVSICPEILGKVNQLGTLDEILEMCKIDERLIPTLDFAHIHAREMGKLNNIDDFREVLLRVENELGFDRLKTFHCHFSKVEYSKGGEKRHVTLDDLGYGPEFIYLAEEIYKKQLEPVIICESRNVMAEDALKLKKILSDVSEVKY